MTGDQKKTKNEALRPDEVIAAFDREREQVKELNQRHTEQVRVSRANDKPLHTDRRRKGE